MYRSITFLLYKTKNNGIKNIVMNVKNWKKIKT